MTPAPDSNLLAGLNSDFETGLFSPWAVSYNTAGTVLVNFAAAANGQSNYGVEIDTTNGIAALLLDKNTLPQDVYQLGKKIRISFDAKRASTTSGWVGGFAQFWNNASGWVGSPQKWFEVKSTWSNVSFEMDGRESLEVNSEGKTCRRYSMGSAKDRLLSFHEIDLQDGGIFHRLTLVRKFFEFDRFGCSDEATMRLG